MTRAVFPLMLLLLLAGCATSRLEVDFSLVDHTRTEGKLLGPATTVVTKGIVPTRIVVDPEFYARGCVSFDVGADGSLSMLIQQDGTSDWIIGRATPGALRDAIVAALGFITSPMDIVKGLLGLPPPQLTPPSDVHGCGGVLEE